MNTNDATPRREPEGTPTGGRFATDTHPEAAGIHLQPEPFWDDVMAVARRQDALEANGVINDAYDSVTDSNVLDALRFDPETGDESETYPHAQHEDAVRALRRYRDASNHVAAGTTDPDRVLTEPLTLAEAVAACTEDGILTGVVEVDVAGIMDAGTEPDDLVALLTADVLPCSPEVQVVGVGGDGALHLQVSTDFRQAYDLEHGDGAYADLKTGVDGVCARCGETYPVADGHGCDDLNEPDQDGAPGDGFDEEN